MTRTPPALPAYDPELALQWMHEALAVAREAGARDEVPVGCVIVNAAGEIVARAGDARQANADPLAHAEWLALREAAAHQGDWRLDGMTLVVTLEPCPMCAGAILMARVGRVIFGARSDKWGAAGTRADWLGGGLFPHKPEVIHGVLPEACAALLTEYFKRRRAQDQAG